MSGLYVEGESKILSGVYSLILAISTAITSGSRGVVAYPFTADWGPVNNLVSGTAGILKESFNAVGSDLSVKKVYTHATKGTPKKVLGYRMADSTAKPAEAVVGDWTLETLYPSTRKFMVVVKEGVEDGTIKLSLVENSVELLVINAATVEALESSINVSDYIRVKKKGAALPEATAGVSFANGSNGDNVTIQQYSAFLDAIEADGTANAFSLDGVEDEAIIASVVAWLSTARQEGFYVTFVNGGPIVWDTALDNANAKSREFNNRAVINVGNGCDGHTAAEMAIFVAARAAAVALNSTLTDETVPYNAVNHRLKRTVREKARQSGTLIFVANGDTVEIDEAVNTLTSPKAGEVVEMGSIRVSSTIDYVVHDLEVFGEEYKKAKSNTEEFRATYATTVEQNYLQPLVRQEILKDGVYYKPDPEYHGDDAIYKPKANEAFFTGDITPNESPERIYQKLLTVF